MPNHKLPRSLFERLSSRVEPVWIFDVAKHNMVWANRAGLEFWRAENVESLRERDFSDDSNAVRTRISSVYDKCRQGHGVLETWTHYPLNEAVVTTIFVELLKELDDCDALLVTVVDASPTVPQSDARLVELTRV